MLYEVITPIFPCQYIIDSAGGYSPAVLLENRVTTGTRHKNIFYLVPRKILQHLSKHGMKKIRAAQIMGRLGTAVQDNPQVWKITGQMLI